MRSTASSGRVAAGRRPRSGSPGTVVAAASTDTEKLAQARERALDHARRVGIVRPRRRVLRVGGARARCLEGLPTGARTLGRAARPHEDRRDPGAHPRDGRGSRDLRAAEAGVRGAAARHLRRAGQPAERRPGVPRAGSRSAPAAQYEESHADPHQRDGDEPRLRGRETGEVLTDAALGSSSISNGSSVISRTVPATRRGASSSPSVSSSRFGSGVGICALWAGPTGLPERRRPGAAALGPAAHRILVP